MRLAVFDVVEARDWVPGLLVAYFYLQLLSDRFSHRQMGDSASPTSIQLVNIFTLYVLGTSSVLPDLTNGFLFYFYLLDASTFTPTPRGPRGSEPPGRLRHEPLLGHTSLSEVESFVEATSSHPF